MLFPWLWPLTSHKLLRVSSDRACSLPPVQVSRWQVAGLVAAAVGNPSVVENKILEVVAEETAPLRQGYPRGLLLADLSLMHCMLLRLHAMPARLAKL